MVDIAPKDLDFLAFQSFDYQHKLLDIYGVFFRFFLFFNKLHYRNAIDVYYCSSKYSINIIVIHITMKTILSASNQVITILIEIPTSAHVIIFKFERHNKRNNKQNNNDHLIESETVSFKYRLNSYALLINGNMRLP